MLLPVAMNLNHYRKTQLGLKYQNTLSNMYSFNNISFTIVGHFETKPQLVSMAPGSFLLLGQDIVWINVATTTTKKNSIRVNGPVDGHGG